MFFRKKHVQNLLLIFLFLFASVSAESTQYKINVSGEHEAIDSNTTLSFRDFSIPTCIDNSRLTLIWNNNGVDQNMAVDVIGDCRTQDVNLFTKTPTGIPANTDLNYSDTNGFKLVILDSNQSSTPWQDIALVYDIANDFEDASVAAYTTGGCGGITFEASTDTSAKGTYSGKLYSGGVCGGGVADRSLAGAALYDWSGYFRGEDSGVGITIRTTGANDDYTGKTSGDAFVTAGSSNETTGGTANAATWYFVESMNGGDINGFFYSLDHTHLITLKDTTGQLSNSTGRFFYNRAAGAGASYLDNTAWWFHVDSPPTGILGAEIVVGANFSVQGDASLNPENGVTDVNRTLVNETNPIGDFNYTWLVDSAPISTDQNAVIANFTIYGDYNVTLIATQNDVNTQKDVNVHISEFPQNVAFTPLTAVQDSNTVFTGSADSNSGISQWYWNFPAPDTNYLGNPVGHIFNTGNNHTVCLTAQDSDDLNKTACASVLASGYINLTIWDENKLVVIPSATIDFNGGTYTTDAGGQLNIPLVGLSTDTYTISVDKNADFSPRTFTYDLNQFSSLDLNILLLETDKGETIEYKIYKPDQTTLFPANSIVELRRSPPNSGIASRILIPETQLTELFVQQDANYIMRITSSDNNQMYDYNGTVVTFLAPIDEFNGDVLTNWDLQVGGLATYNFSGISGDQSFLIFSDTTGFYLNLVDLNTEYYPRNYLVKTRGGQPTLTIQPYLLRVADSIQVIWQTFKTLSEVTLTGIRITTYRVIGGETTVVEDALTDGTGVAGLSFTPGIDYNIAFFDSENNIIFSASYRPNSSDTTKKAYLNVESVDIPAGDEPIIQINYIQSDGFVRPNSPVDFNQTLSVFAGTLTEARLTIIHGGTTLVNQIYSITDANGSLFSIGATVDTSGLDTSIPIVVDVNTTTVDGFVKSFSKSYFITTRATSVTEAARAAKTQDLGKSFAAIIAVFITILIAGAAANLSPFQDSAPVSLIVIPILGVFVYWQWIAELPFIIGTLAAIITTFTTAGNQGRF